MLTDFAQRLADCHEITNERLEAVLIYLRAKLAREKEEECATSFIAFKSLRLIEESLRIRGMETPHLDQDAG